MPSAPSAPSKAAPANLRAAENALARLGFSKIPPLVASAPSPEFWVQEAGVPRRVFPVFFEPGAERERSGRYVSWVGAKTDAAVARAIVVVPSDDAAKEAWQRVRTAPNGLVESELAILVIPESPGPTAPHWHRGIVPPRELLRLATGIAVGLYHRAHASEGSAQVDFGEMLEILRARFNIDVAGSLGVSSDEDALFILYQLALRHAYAPGDPGANLHLLVLKPTGPAARLPWFAA